MTSPAPRPRRALDRIMLDRDVYTLACERTAYVMDHHDRVAVSFSGGKDSTAVLNVALDVANREPRFHRHLPLRVLFADEEAIPYETEAYVRRVAQRPDVALEWYCIPIQHRNACSRRSPYWWPWAPEDEAKWVRPMPPEAIRDLPGFPVWPAEARLTWPDANGLLAPPPHTTAMLMGIRADESLIRQNAVRQRAVDNYIIRYAGATDHGNIWKAYTVFDWAVEDVWAAVRVHGWDYNRAYDLMEMAGTTLAKQRCSPAFGEEPLAKIPDFARCFPDVWERMAERVPGVGAAFRYARTELYGFGSQPPKPAGRTWPDHVTHYLQQHAPDQRPRIAERVRKMLGLHYRATSDPVLPEAVHPHTGVSWRWLTIIAMRGDYKERRQPAHNLNRRDKRVLWAKYTTELAQVLADGTGPELGHPRPLPTDPYALIPDQYKDGTR